MQKCLKAFVKSNRILHSIALRIHRLRSRYRRSVSGTNNIVRNQGVTINVKYDIVGNNNLIEIMKGAVLSDMLVYIRGNGHKVKIGEGCFFKGGSIWFEDHDGELHIGQNTSIESAHLAVTEPGRKIVIGQDCMFSSAIEFRTGDSHSIVDSVTGVRINDARDIAVGNHVWIGAHSIILKGVTIGDNSIIGTRSVVTKDVPSHSIAAGSPARIVKDNVDWVRERIYD